MGSAPRVTFIIPVRNDASRLDACLRSITANAADGCNVEIVVADNGSTDASTAVAQHHGATVLSLPNLRLGELRNRAASVARGTILAFVDADHEIARGWLAAAVECLSLPGVAAAGAPCRPPGSATWVQVMYDRLRRHPRGQEETSWLGSGNLVVTRAAFEAAGGFDSTLETCEDVDLCRKLRAAGWRIVADERLRNTHHGDPRTLTAVFMGELWRGRDNLKVSLRRPFDWRTVTSAAIPGTNLAALTFAACGVLSFAPAGRFLASLALTVPLLLIAARGALMLWRVGRLRELPQALALAAAYEMGRAAAIVARGTSYERKRTGTTS